jgi:hypothetical protein
MNTLPNTLTLRSVSTQRGAMHCAIASRNGAALAFYPAAWNVRIPTVRDVQSSAKWRDAEQIPTGEATELECELIEVTARTFAPVVRRTAAAALIGAATVAQAHPGHSEALQQDAVCALVALSCVAIVRAVAARRVEVSQ